MKFQLGQVVATPGATRIMEENEILPTELLRRHLRGDWGEVDPEDWKTNDDSVANGLRILSSYGKKEKRLWVITEADRSVTTILRPDEY